MYDLSGCSRSMLEFNSVTQSSTEEIFLQSIPYTLHLYWHPMECPPVMTDTDVIAAVFKFHKEAL